MLEPIKALATRKGEKEKNKIEKIIEGINLEEMKEFNAELTQYLKDNEPKPKDPEKTEYQTWLLQVNISNIEYTYRIVKANGGYYHTASNRELKHLCSTEFTLHDTIDWQYIDWNKMRTYFKEMYEEE